MVQMRKKYAYDKILDQMVKIQRRKGKMSNAKLKVLWALISKPYMSAYSISKSLNELNDKVVYQNIREIVLKLEKSNLITPHEAKWNEKIHKAKHYKLTTTGILELLVNDSLSMTHDVWKGLIRHHGNNIIIKSFLNPIMEKRTAMRLTSDIIIDSLLDFLKNCCKELEVTLGELQNYDELTMPLFVWEEIPRDKRYNKAICIFLHDETGLNFSRANITKSMDGGTILVSSTHNATISLNNDDQKAIVKVNDKTICELLLARDTEYFVGKKSKVLLTSVSKQIQWEESNDVIREQFESEIVYHLFVMSCALITGLRPFETPVPPNLADYELLARDKRMSQLFMETRLIIQDGVEFINKLSVD